MFTKRMPVLFIGHGNPMNALKETAFTKTLNAIGKTISRPRLILCISAHWLTEGTWVTHMPQPKTVHDFYGFPQELFEVQYAAPGSPQAAELIRDTITEPSIQLDDEIWGIDHGAWSVLKHLYPQADIPVLQLSINFHHKGPYHYALGQQLRFLRDQGVLIIGSGNIVHDLQKLKWQDNAQPYDWAIEFDEWVKERLIKKEFNSLVDYRLDTQAGRLSIPTPDHYYPLLYVLGAADEHDRLKFEYEGIENASISMRCFSYTA
jgi:4,5-DOPA dioxygenase extradiol